MYPATAAGSFQSDRPVKRSRAATIIVLAKGPGALRVLHTRISNGCRLSERGVFHLRHPIEVPARQGKKLIDPVRAQ